MLKKIFCLVLLLFFSHNLVEASQELNTNLVEDSPIYETNFIEVFFQELNICTVIKANDTSALEDLFLQPDTNPNQICDETNQTTPLFLAIEMQNPKAVKILLDNNASAEHLSSNTNDNIIALQWAIQQTTDEDRKILNMVLDATSISNIENLDQLNDAIKNGPNRRVGFLSQSNFESVEAFLDKNVEAVIFGDSTMLENAVIEEDILAGLMSGVPGTGPTAFNTFPSQVISPRAFQMMPEDGAKDLLHAVDAAVVRTQIDGELLQAERDNPPFQAQYVQNCYTGDHEKLPFPPANETSGLLKDILDQRKIRVLAYGAPNDKPNWNEDGNYQVDPPTGFWPDYLNYFLGQFQKAYGEDITLERVWMKSEDGTNMVLNGTIHMTEPYFIYEAIEFETPKKWSFDFSCIVMGYEQTYFTLKH